MDPDVFITIVLASLVGLFMIGGAIYASSEARRGGMPRTHDASRVQPRGSSSEERGKPSE